MASAADSAQRRPGIAPRLGAAARERTHFTYQLGGAHHAARRPTAVGVLVLYRVCTAGKGHDPVVVGGVASHLMANLPEENSRNIYYWYYASQALHNMDDKDWDTWNRKMREILVREQVRTGVRAPEVGGP